MTTFVEAISNLLAEDDTAHGGHHRDRFVASANTTAEVVDLTFYCARFNKYSERLIKGSFYLNDANRRPCDESRLAWLKHCSLGPDRRIRPSRAELDADATAPENDDLPGERLRPRLRDDSGLKHHSGFDLVRWRLRTHSSRARRQHKARADETQHRNERARRYPAHRLRPNRERA